MRTWAPSGAPPEGIEMTTSWPPPPEAHAALIPVTGETIGLGKTVAGLGVGKSGQWAGAPGAVGTDMVLLMTGDTERAMSILGRAISTLAFARVSGPSPRVGAEVRLPRRAHVVSTTATR